MLGGSSGGPGRKAESDQAGTLAAPLAFDFPAESSDLRRDGEEPGWVSGPRELLVDQEQGVGEYVSSSPRLTVEKKSHDRQKIFSP